MLFSQAQCSNMSKEELRKLREGEVIVGEDGKRYRVRKTMLPQEAAGGPHGIGDPDDRSLRKIEADVLIPDLMNKVVQRIECREEVRELAECLRKENAARGLMTCKEILGVFNECKKRMFADPQFRQRITEEYLHERSEARRTGMGKKDRELEKFRKWKEEQQQK